MKKAQKIKIVQKILDIEDLIKLQNITKVYNQSKENEFTALKKIDLKINKGEFVAIMGPSGSGKTTLMNILGALDAPTEGNYFIKGKDISKYSENELATFRNKDVGFVFQRFNLLPRNNVRENILLPTLYGFVKDKQKKLEEVLDKVGIFDKMNSKPNQLSGGEVQRVAIARALMMEPSIIMADEPTGNLDTKTADGVMDILAGLNKEGNTIIVVTHEEDVAKYAKRIIRLRDGMIESSSG